MKKPITVYDCTCERCGNNWISRVEEPVRCAKCKSPYWNKPRRLLRNHAKYPMLDWKEAIAHGATHLGYNDWVAQQVAQEKEDAA